MAKSEHVVDVSEANFQTEVIDRSYEQPVVVDFWAPWCGPCRMLGPILERLAGEGDGRFRLAKLNTDENQGLAARYDIRGIPAVKAFRDGQVVSEFVGAQPEPNVRRFLDEIAPGEAAAAQANAAALLAQRKWAEAEAAYRETATDGRPLPVGYAKALLGQGKGAEAMAALAGVTDGAEFAAAETLKPLAQLLVDSQDGAGVDGAPELDGLLRQAGQLAAEGRYAAAMDALLAVMRKDKRYKGDTPRKAILAIFELLGDEDALTRDYRKRLASALF
jgi:putative thioredoxin